MQTRGATGTSEWKQFAIELPVAAAATNITFGVLMPGDGTAWFDDLAVELDGQPYTNPSVFDFGFESPSIRGLMGGGAGYRVELDSTMGVPRVRGDEPAKWAICGRHALCSPRARG